MYKIVPDGTNLTEFTNQNFHTPKVSPDGTRLLFFLNNILHIKDIESNTNTALLDTAFTPAPENISWSPSGSYLVFDNLSDDSTRNDIILEINVVETIPGSMPITLVSDEFSNANPIWLPVVE